jgi:hypothetical protein
VVFGVVSSASLVVACAGGDFEPEASSFAEDEIELESIGTLEQPLCENKGGTNAVMTALAVAAGKELGRWLPERDFQWNNSTGMLELSVNAAPRCRTASPTGTCGNLLALLAMQKPEAHGKVTFPGNIKLDSNLLKSQLKSGWNAQASCNASGACNVVNHDLKYAYVENGSCDKKFFFDPFKMGTSTRMSASEADLLKNKLKFVGYPTNKMLNFYMRDGKVSVDPTYGLNEGASTTVGSCDAACTKFSTSDVSNRCCSCNGATKTYKRSPFSGAVYLCI